jgi:adenine-specific DNA-methyltransferase
MDKLDMKTNDLTDQNIEKIAKLFPGVITEQEDDNGEIKKAIDFDLLKQELAKEIVEGGEERYRLDWPGKKASILKANTPINKTLRPVKEDSVDFDNTENLYLEGDNFEILKVLQESYIGHDGKGTIKMIYIDPPYNTGKDFVYRDNFKQDKDEYDEEVGAKDEDGNKLFKNTETNGRFHSDWLSMMYERLVVARDILKDDGVIFISINDKEVHNLRKVCDEVFGEGNFIDLFLWEKTSTPPALSNKSRKTNEFIICYEKNKDNFKYFGEELDNGDAPLLNSGNKIKDLIFPKGSIRFKIPDGTYVKGEYDRVTIKNDIIVKEGSNINEVSIAGEFKWTQEATNDEISKGTYFLIKSDKFSIRFQRNCDADNYKTPTNYIDINKLDRKLGIGTNESANKELSSLDMNGIFDYPKPISLIEYLIDFKCKDDKNAIILDFFSGSSSTAHAVCKKNSRDGGNRKFLMLQLDENLDDSLKFADQSSKKTIESAIKFLDSINKPHSLAEIGKERIKRASRKIKEEDKNKDLSGIDFGFRVFKIDSSNMKDVYYNPKEISQDLLSTLEDNIKEDRSPEDLLFQVMLDLGLTLDLKIDEKEISGNKVFFVAENSLVACFDKDIEINIVDEIAKDKPLKVVFRDASFKDDKDRINVEERFKRLSPETKVSVI